MLLLLPPVQYDADGKKGTKTNPLFINADEGSAGMQSNPLYFQHTEQTQAFEKVGGRSPGRPVVYLSPGVRGRVQGGLCLSP